MNRKYIISLAIIGGLLMVGCNQQRAMNEQAEEEINDGKMVVESTGNVDEDIAEIEKEIDELNLDDDFPDLDVSEFDELE